MATGWNFTGAFYHVSQNSWTIGLGTGGTQGIGCSGAGLLCSGDFTEESWWPTTSSTSTMTSMPALTTPQVTDGLAWGFASDQSGAGSGTTGSESHR
jgi:hypothetical protein